MDEKELDLSQVNEIDMECEVDPEEDDGFGGQVTTSQEKPQYITKQFLDDYHDAYNQADSHGSANDGRDLVVKTGIIIDLSDDDEIEYRETPDVEVIDSNPLIVQDEQEILNASNGLLGDENLTRSNLSGINEIDMECSVGEDDDDVSFGGSVGIEKRQPLDLGDEDEEVTKLLVDEAVVKQSIQERKNEIDQGVVERDYWKRLQDKHKKSNVKGSYNTHFHFAGNPELEMDDFNHDNTPKGPIPNATNVHSVGAGDMLGGENIGGMTGGMGESVNPHKKLFEEVLNIIGFKLDGAKDNKCILKDLYSNATKECSSINDIQDFLNPYIEDCFILPLQVTTGENYKTCQDWVNWYKKDGVKAKHPECEKDIVYCDLWANHLGKCDLFR